MRKLHEILPTLQISFIKTLKWEHCIECDKRHNTACVNEVAIGLQRGTTFTAM